jgi:hypothetical protein
MSIFTSGCPASQSNTQVTTKSSTSTGELKSIYDGTYIGTFNYMYKLPDYSNPATVWTTINDSFTLSITLKTRVTDPDIIYLNVTNVVSSEPGFGTGSDGIVPHPYSQVILPTKLPSTMQAASGLPDEIYIKFSNGTFLKMDYVYVNSDASTLTYYPEMSQSPQKWSSNVSLNTASNSTVNYTWDALGWSLKKVSP